MNKLLIRFVLISFFAAGIIAPVRGAELAIRTVDSETGQPVSNANISLLEIGQITTTDKNGSSRFDALPPGKYHISTSHIAYEERDSIAIEIPHTSPFDIPLQPKHWLLNQIVVTGTRSPHILKDVPVQTEVVTSRDFAEVGAKTVDEALSSSIGININNDLSGQGATIRGIEGSRVLVMVDGERAVGRVNGSIDLGQFALNNVDKIEVIKGTGATLYGSDAMGGVINIISRKPSENSNRISFSSDYGSNASMNLIGDMEYGRDGTGLAIGGKYYHTDGFDLDPSTPATNGREAIDRWNFSGKVSRRLSPAWHVTGSGRFMQENLDWIEAETIKLSEIKDTTYIYNDNETNRRYDGSVTFDFHSNDRYWMKLRFSGTYYDHIWKKYSGPYWTDTSKTQELYAEASYTANYITAKSHMATFGIDLGRQELRSEELIANTPPEKSAAGYFQYEISFLKSLSLVSGIRYEHHNSFGDHVNPSVNLMWRPSNAFKLRGFVGKGFRAPSIKEQYFIFDHTAAGYIVYGGSAAEVSSIDLSGLDIQDLKSETSINSSISAEILTGSLGLHRLTYYYNHLNNMIDFQLIGFPDPYWRGLYVYQNIETAITQGIEWESRVRLSSLLEISVSYDYLHSRNLGTGERLLNRPDHGLKVILTGYSNRWRAGAAIWGDWESDKLWVARSNTGENEGDAELAPSRSTVNLNLFKRFGSGTEAFVRFMNIFDETNAVYGYWPGFDISAGFKLTFNNN